MNPRKCLWYFRGFFFFGKIVARERVKKEYGKKCKYY